MVTIFCPHCGMELQIDEKHIGQQGRCKCCNQMFTAKPVQDDKATLSSKKPARISSSGISGDSIKKWALYLFIFIGFTLGTVAVLSDRQERPTTRSSQEATTQSGRTAGARRLESLTLEQRNAITAALSQEGFPPYSSLSVSDSGDWVIVKYQLSPDALAASAFSSGTSLESTLESFGNKAVMTVRNAMYSFNPPDGTAYRVTLYGPPPGPGLVKVYGSARFSGSGVDWKLGQP